MRLAVFCWPLAALSLLGGCAAALDRELQSAKQAQQPIYVGDLAPSDPDKRGRISALAQFFNTSPHTYKYVDFHVEAYNRVGDRVTREGDATPGVQLRFTGPLAPRRTPGVMTWPAVWRIATITCLRITRLDITHIDGTTRQLEGQALNATLATRLTTRCLAKP